MHQIITSIHVNNNQCHQDEVQREINTRKCGDIKLLMKPRSYLGQDGGSFGISSNTFSDILSNQQSPSSRNEECMIETLCAMLNQEKKVYSCEDYIYGIVTAPKLDLTFHVGNEKCKLVDETCREKICDWYYRIIDFFKVDREAVYLAMSYLDRFLMACKVDRSTYKIAATASLVIALKVHSESKISLQEVIPVLSKGEFSTSDVNEMEVVILKSMTWCINPPTPMSYVIRLLLLNPFASKPIQEIDLDGIQSFAIFFVELSIIDYFFVTKRQSLIAYSAILNAMEGFGLWSPVGGKARANSITIINYVHKLSTLLNITHNNEHIVTMRNRLWGLYKRSEEMSRLLPQKLVEEVPASQVSIDRSQQCRLKRLVSKENTLSPTSVSHHNIQISK